ncbi:MAG: DUF370 domain-containing protein [Firmicutes bacterium]|jgi:hypothetical protein|nr:DUF370 domain-containing protein [Bacillota bacterium]
MFLHLGQDVMVPLEDVVSIVNLAGVGTSDNELLVKTATEQGFVIQLSEDPISCIVTTSRIYLSPISVQTLQKRALRRY